MNYEKLYKDTIAKLQEMVNSGKITVEIARGICADFIPENEDERIRKIQLEYWSAFGGKDRYGIPVQKVISWLEKQGEHANFINKIQIGDKVTRNEDGGLVNLSQLNRVAKKDEKQGEQKYIPKYKIGDYVKNTNYKGEPIYEIVYMDKECYICEYRGNERMGDKAVMHFSFDNPYLRLVQKPAEEYNITGIHSKNAKGKLGEMIKNLKPVNEVLEQKSWSEEDEAIYYGVIETEQYMLDVVNGIKKFNVGNISIKEECTRELNWLKSLKDRVQPQPKQEWNEEDEFHFKSIESTIEYCKKEVAENDDARYNEDLNWLKSLKDRYAWKPSDKHMKALYHIIEDNGLTECKSEDEIAIEDLVGQLEKLRK